VVQADTETGAPPRLLIIIAAVLAAGLAVGVGIFGLTMNTGNDTQAMSGPLPLVPVPAPQAGSPQCAALIGALPAALTSNGAKLTTRQIAAPAPPATVAWGGAEPVVLRCGLDKPPELTPTAQLRVINGVQWLQVAGEGAATWYVVDREVYTALTVPASAGTGPLQEVSDTIAAKLKPQPLRF
jgi:hypothetical protein